MSSINLDLTGGIPWEVIRAPDVMAKGIRAGGFTVPPTVLRAVMPN
jgi:hypothetical protein